MVEPTAVGLEQILGCVHPGPGALFADMHGDAVAVLVKRDAREEKGVRLVRANIDAKRSCGVAVPRTAIDHLTVQVVKGNTVETRKVRTGLVSDTSTEILEGLDVGEIVVADAGSSLHDGDQIKTMFAEELDRTRVR